MESEEYEDYGDYDYDEYQNGSDTEEHFFDEEIEESLPFASFTKQELLLNTSAVLKEVKEFLGLTEGETVLLLMFFSWDKQKCMEEYVGDSEEIANKAGFLISKNIKLDGDSKFECPVCLNDVAYSHTYALSCGHTFCNDCWMEYLNLNVYSGFSCTRSPCQAPNCKVKCPIEIYKKFLNKKAFTRYQNYIINSYVELCQNRKWCPSPTCNNYCQVTSTNQLAPVECKCGFRFCFQCHDYDIGDHSPATCDQTKSWTALFNDSETEDLLWINAYTQKCPRCMMSIEKNGGCMHMTCRYCLYEFCWLCRKNWFNHTSCNKATIEEVEKKAQDAKDKLKHLQPYLFHFHRFKSHKDAKNIAIEQKSQCLERAETLKEVYNITLFDLKFLEEAAQQLIHNRNMLQNSYIYAFYLSIGPKKKKELELFQYLQNDLEHHTDKLSELFESSIKDLDIKSFNKWKEGVINYLNVSKKFLNNFIEGVVTRKLQSR